MALFRRSGPVVFERHAYGRRRSSWAPPRWLLLLLAGVAAGAGGLYALQEEYLPPRLTTAQSQQLQGRVDELEAVRGRLQAELDDTQRRLKVSAGENAGLVAALGAARQSVERLQKDVALFDQVLPPDPRSGAIAVRAARFSDGDGQLAYHVLLTRDQKAARPFKGVVQLVVAGERGGRNETVTLDPLEVTLAGYQHLQGSLPLPPGFAARQATIRVLDGPGGRQLGTRVINVR